MQPAASTLLMILAASALVSEAAPANHHQHSRELAALVAAHPGTSLAALREARRQVRRTQASLKLVIALERDLSRAAAAARGQRTRAARQAEVEPGVQHQQASKQKSKMNEDDQKFHPFSPWAGR